MYFGKVGSRHALAQKEYLDGAVARDTKCNNVGAILQIKLQSVEGRAASGGVTANRECHLYAVTWQAGYVK